MAFLGFLVFIYDPFHPEGEVIGTVKSVYKPESRYAMSTKFIVELDSGGVADVRADRMGTFKKGKLVVLQELKSTVFRRKAYKFLRVYEPNPKKRSQNDVKDYEIKDYNKAN